jgi:hypothetical protein
VEETTSEWDCHTRLRLVLSDTLFARTSTALCIKVSYEPSVKTFFTHRAHYLRHERRRSGCLHLSECAEYAVFAHRSCVQYVLKRTLCLICSVPFVNRWRLSVACQSVNRINSHLFSLFRNFQHPN